MPNKFLLVPCGLHLTPPSGILAKLFAATAKSFLVPLFPVPFVSSHATSLLGLFHAASAGSAEYICKLFSRQTFAGATILFVGGCEGDFFVVCDIQVTIWPDLSKELCSVQIPQICLLCLFIPGNIEDLSCLPCLSFQCHFANIATRQTPPEDIHESIYGCTFREWINPV